MGEYDRVIKENIEAIFLPLLEKLLNIKIKKSFEIKDKIQKTIEREPDFLKKIIDDNNSEFILQIEFQTNNDPEMVYRMAEYKAIIQRKYQLPVRQFVIYLGAIKPTMKTQLPSDEQITGFELKNIHDFPADITLKSDVPEEIILSILADYSKVDTKKVIEQIIAKLQKATKNETQLRQSIQQLLILSRLRNLDEAIENQIKDMPITYDITTDRLYNKGIEQGIEQGIEKNRNQIILNALKKKKLTVEEIADLAGATINEVLSIQSSLSS